MRNEYHAFLMRLQRNQSGMPWRVTLENAHTGEVLHFASELQLIDYLFKSFAAEDESNTFSLLNPSEEDPHFEEK